MLILAIDPGGTSGFAFWDSKHREFEGYPYKPWEIPEVAQVPQASIWDALENSRPDILVVETFTYRQKVKASLAAAEVIGVIKEWARQKRVPVHWQTPSQGKDFYDDDRLRQYDSFHHGLVHANDATRHLLYFLEFGEGKDIAQEVGFSPPV